MLNVKKKTKGIKPLGGTKSQEKKILVCQFRNIEVAIGTGNRGGVYFIFFRGANVCVLDAMHLI
jgi:hypothetical protein